MNREQVHETLPEALEEQSVVDRLRSVGALRLAARVVQEHQVQVRAVAELQAAELAVRNHDHVCDAHCTARVRVVRHAVPGLDLRACQRHCFLHDQFGDVRETVADLHQRQPADQVRHCDPEQGRALELAQQLDLPLRLFVLHVLPAHRQLVRELRSRGRFLDEAFVDELVEQQRLGGNLICQELALLAQRDEPAHRRRAFVEQREIDRAPADALQDFQQARQRGFGRFGLRDERHHSSEQLVQAAPARLVEPAVVRSVAELIERRSIHVHQRGALLLLRR